MPEQTPLAFFSYSRHDAEFVLKLAQDLRAGGAGVWLDQLDISPGQRWDSAIERALAGCLHLLVVLSPSSVESTNVMDEVSFALEEGKVVIPVLYRDCKIPFRLRRLQYIDARVTYESGLASLLAMLGARGHAEPPVVTVSSISTEKEEGQKLPAEIPGTRKQRSDHQQRVQSVKTETDAVEKTKLGRDSGVTDVNPRSSRIKYLVAMAAAPVLVLGIWAAIPKTNTFSVKGNTAPQYVTPQDRKVGAVPIDAAWVKQFLEAGEGPPVSRVRQYFDDVVSPYFSQPTARWDAIKDDKEAYFRRFPTIHYTLVGQPEITTLPGGVAILEFDMQYSNVRMDGRTLAGTSHISMNLRSVEGLWKITSIRERR